MRNKVLRMVTVVLSAVVFAAVPSEGGAESGSGRSRAIDAALDCVARGEDPAAAVTWQDVCATDDSLQQTDTARRREMIDRQLEKFSGKLKESHEEFSGDVYDRDHFRDTNQRKDRSTATEIEPSSPWGQYLQYSGEIEKSDKNFNRRVYKSGHFESDPIHVSSDRLGGWKVEGTDSLNREPEDPLYVQEKPMDPAPNPDWFYDFFGRDNPLNVFEIGTEAYDYRYREPSFGVKDTGTFYGIYASYTHRTRENNPVSSPAEIFQNGNTVNMYRLDARFGIGSVDYEGSGTYDGIRDYVTEIRGVAGLDVPFSRVTVTPYFGVGFRYLLDKFSEVPPQTIGGVNYLSGYDRESRYVYLPLGVEASSRLSSRWSLNMNAELDIFITGRQYSHLEDSETAAGVNAGYGTVKNDQDEGYGARGSIKLSHHFENIDINVEPFVRWWSIDDSNVALDSNNIIAGLEPENDTREMGVKLGVSF